MVIQVRVSVGFPNCTSPEIEPGCTLRGAAHASPCPSRFLLLARPWHSLNSPGSATLRVGTEAACEGECLGLAPCRSALHLKHVAHLLRPIGRSSELSGKHRDLTKHTPLVYCSSVAAEQSAARSSQKPGPREDPESRFP